MPVLWAIFVRVIAIGLTWTCAKLNIAGTGDFTVEATVIATVIVSAFSLAIEHSAPALWKRINKPEPPTKGTP